MRTKPKITRCPAPFYEARYELPPGERPDRVFERYDPSLQTRADFAAELAARTIAQASASAEKLTTSPTTKYGFVAFDNDISESDAGIPTQESEALSLRLQVLRAIVSAGPTSRAAVASKLESPQWRVDRQIVRLRQAGFVVRSIEKKGGALDRVAWEATEEGGRFAADCKSPFEFDIGANDSESVVSKLREFGPMPIREISEHTKIDGGLVGRQLNRLLGRKIVKKIGKIRCAKRGCPVIVWSIA